MTELSDADLAAREVLLPNTDIGGHNVTFEEAVGVIVRWAREGSGGYVSTPNIDHMVRARREPAFGELVKGARLRVPDGMGIIYGSRIAGRPLRGAVHGRLLPEAIVRRASDGSVPIALIGGRDDAPARATERLQALGGRVVAAIKVPMGFEIGGADDEA